MMCKQCGNHVRLRKDENRRLYVGCDCEEIATKVASVLPDDWGGSPDGV